jgi:hypothetical protein
MRLLSASAARAAAALGGILHGLLWVALIWLLPLRQGIAHNPIVPDLWICGAPGRPEFRRGSVAASPEPRGTAK